MDGNSRMAVAMAKRFRSVISASDLAGSELPITLQRPHLLWMCDQIEKHAEHGAITKVQRWIGFIEGAIVANRMLKPEELKEMFDQAKAEEALVQESIDDLTDHLDATDSFEFDIGGQG